MNAGWALRLALASLEEEAFAVAPVTAFGLVLPEQDGEWTFQLRNRCSTSVRNGTSTDFPTPLRAPFESIRQFVPLAPHLDVLRGIDESLALFGANALLVIPLPDARGALWAARQDVREFGHGEVAALARFAARLVDASRVGEPPALREACLARLDSLAAVLPLLGSALDIRDVFDRLSAITSSVLPHDSSLVGILSEDQRKVRLYALSGVARQQQLPETVDNAYSTSMNQGWEFAIVRDTSLHPVERDQLAGRLGFRSCMRVPVRLDGRIAGVIDFSAYGVNQYREADVPVLRRIADLVTVALSHQRLADEGRRAAELRERAANLEMLDGLLDTLAGVLDVREVFAGVSDIAQKVLAHDAMSVSVITEDAERVRIYASRGLGDEPSPVEYALPDKSLLTRPWDHELIEDLASSGFVSARAGLNAGMESVLIIPVRLQGRLHGSVNFFARRKGRFTRGDMAAGRRVADHIAMALSHHQLAEEARLNVELRARAANLELMDELLATVTSAGDLPEVFDRVSSVAQRVLPHDALVLTAVLPDRLTARVYASKTPAAAPFPGVVAVPPAMLANPNWDYDLVEDLQAQPDQRKLDAAKAGYRGALRVAIRIGGEYAAGLSFLSFTPSRYSVADVPAARRVADTLTVSFSRERSKALLKRVDEATARASQLESRVRALTDELDARTGYRRVIGQSPQWRQVLTQATQVAATDTTVLILGESGTGKEVVARFVHRASARKNGPYVALNCAALPEQLLEAELFGYERGAFTGAIQSKPGQLEQAAGGTLFLDEVAEMSPSAQAKFLRVLQEREFQRLGGTRVIRTDARIVAATNRDLQRAMDKGHFREDLFYRLNVFAIQLPGLRDRRDDILPLSDAFVTEFGRSLGRPPAGISREARQALMEYHWPGNVRELRNVLERAAILADGGLIAAEHLALRTVAAAFPQAVQVGAAAPPAAPHVAPPQPAAAPVDLKSMERALIEKALQEARFNKSVAAKTLGLTRAQLYVRLRKYGLE